MRRPPLRAAPQQPEVRSAAAAPAAARGAPPIPPTADESAEEAEEYFQKLVVWVNVALEEALATKALGLRSKGKKPNVLRALPIQARDAQEQSCSYKAPSSL